MDLLEEEFDEILNIFQVEADEIISRLNRNLLDLEKKPSNKDAILLIFRDAHSLKGAARMIGFNNVQTIAHKIEDILGLAKDDKIQLNTNIVDILYKAVDFMTALIHKSIAQKKEIYNEDVADQISLLEHIGELVEDTYSKENSIDFDLELLTQSMPVINKLIPQSLANLMKIEIEKNPSIINKLLGNINELYDLFKKIGIFDIKQGFEDISVKLDFVNKGSQILTESESDSIQETLNNIIISLISICEIHNLEILDYYAEAFQIDLEAASAEPTEKVVKKEEPKISAEEENPVEEVHNQPIVIAPKTEFEADFKAGLEKIQSMFSTLTQDSNSLPLIKEFLEDFDKKCSNESVQQVIQLIVKILDYIGKNQMNIEEDTVSALQQAVEYCSDTLKNNVDTADKELIIQRLEIVQQLLEFNTEQNEDFMAVPQKNMPPKTEKFSDFSKIFDTGEIKTLRVDSTKLDTLVNQVGELIVTKIKSKKHMHEMKLISKDLEEWQRSALKALNYLKYYDKKYFSQAEMADNPISFFVKQLLNLFSDNNKKFGEAIYKISNLQRAIQEDDMKMNLIVDDLEHLVKKIRVLPLATVFHLFGRMVRDIAQEKGKKIDLEIIGSETSTDKKIIEEIKIPLIHIIRNAIDHGIETPEERIALGKNPAGKIILSARQVNNNIVIEIKDDGKGINLTKIKEKAIHKGYLSEEEAKSMTDEQITNLIFIPGFSTEEEITNLSGRGIGLDVVQTKISQLNGKVKIISEMNKGCCVQIELPTTMSTLKAFLVKSSGQTFAIPMAAINTVVWKKSDEIRSNKGVRSIVFNEKTISVYRLSDILNLQRQEIPESTKRETVLIIESDNKIIGLAVDKLIGDQEILHKKLSAPLYRLKNISGVTTLVSGEICLILNISDILKTVASPITIKTQNQAQISSNVTPDAINLDGTLEKSAEKKRNDEYKILLVDDSITTRTLEKNILTKAGYKIETATQPSEAFEKLKIERFDMIISDIEMPDMNGFEFLSELKINEMYFDIPVIIVSSLVSEEYKKRATNLGAAGYIVKGDFNQSEFLDKINEILTAGK